jgi:AbrB family looped-hinge helix DNA binding protein
MTLQLEVAAGGDIILPHELLQHLGIHPGDQIEVTELPGGRIEVRASKRPDPLDDPSSHTYDDR